MSATFAADPVLHHSHRILREPDEFGDAVSGMNLSVDFQRRQERASRVEQFQTAGWALDFGEANVRTRVRGVLLGEWGSLCLSLGPGGASWNSEAADPGTICLLPPGDEVDGRTTADFAWMTAAVPPHVWRECLSLAGLEEDRMRRVTVCPLPAALFAEIKSRQQSVHRLIRQGADFPCCRPAALRDAAAFVRESFTTLCELAAKTKPPRDSLRNRVRLVRRASVWLHDHLSEPVQVPDLCLALRVSRRELEYAFRSTMEQSPRDYLQMLRLNAVRRALLRTDSHHSLIRIAYDHGVTHLGRFAANYRSLFGEKPSETRRG